MWRFFAITNSSRFRAKSGQLHWDKPAQFAACEVVFSEAQAAFQPSSCCSQRRAGLAFSGEISIPARRWQYNHDMISCLEGTASLGIVFPDGKQRNNTGGKSAPGSLLPPRSGLLRSVGTRSCLSLLILTPLCHSHPLAWWLVPTGVFVLQPRCGEQHRGLCFGQADLAGPAVRNSRAPVPLPAPCPADLVLTPQLTSWLLYIYFFRPALPALCFLPAGLQDWQLGQAPAKSAALTLCCTPRNTPCGHPGERDRLHSHPTH